MKTLIAVEPAIITAMRLVKHKNQCFEVYGFDVMVDAKLRPWLLEVNVAPSLSSSSPYDKQVKCKLLCDTLHLVGFRVFDRKRVADDTKKVDRSRLFGLTSKPQSQQNRFEDMVGGLTPVKQHSGNLSDQGSIKYGSSGKEKVTLPSFLEGF